MAGRRNRRRAPAPVVRLPAVNWAAIVMVAAAVTVVLAVYVSTLWLMDRPIESVVVNGTFERVSAMQVEQALGGHVRRGFLTVDLEAIRHDVTALPWVADAAVRRRWPGVIELTVREEAAVACWLDRGLLNGDGELFVAEVSHVPAELPRLSGPEGSEARVTALYFRIERELEQRGHAARALALDARGGWTLTLRNGLVARLGGEALDERLARFYTALDEVIAGRAGEIDYLDMRYTNGFAVGWRRGQPVDALPARNGEPSV